MPTLKRLTRRSFLGAAGAWAALLSQAAPAVVKREDWRALGEDVREQMRWAWQQYREHAWGKDQIKPISGGFESFPLKNRHLGLSLIEALDTLWIMGLDDEFRDGVASTATCRCSKHRSGWSADCSRHGTPIPIPCC
jgi:mannosyl-oligosaccharide alpha-1,2-mannosidase